MILCPLYVVINEILADPSPPVLLPEQEYIELFNRSDHEISINGWQFSANNNSIELPDEVIPSGEYAVLINGEDFEGREEPESASLNCRVYENGLPSIEEIRDKILSNSPLQ